MNWVGPPCILSKITLQNCPGERPVFERARRPCRAPLPGVWQCTGERHQIGAQRKANDRTPDDEQSEQSGQPTQAKAASSCKGALGMMVGQNQLLDGQRGRGDTRIICQSVCERARALSGAMSMSSTRRIRVEKCLGFPLGDEKRWFLPGARPGGQRGAHGPDVLSERLNALARH
jgi:hypothetical protein